MLDLSVTYIQPPQIEVCALQIAHPGHLLQLRNHRTNFLRRSARLDATAGLYDKQLAQLPSQPSEEVAKRMISGGPVGHFTLVSRRQVLERGLEKDPSFASDRLAIDRHPGELRLQLLNLELGLCVPDPGCQ
jgi:hypothetical protein